MKKGESMTAEPMSKIVEQCGGENVLRDIIQKAENLTLPYESELLLSFLRYIISHSRFPPKQLDHAQNVHHY